MLLESTRSTRRAFLGMALLVAGCLMSGGAVSAQPPAAGASTIRLGDFSVTPNPNYNKSVIAVAPFDVTGVALDKEAVPRIIRKDLDYSGFFAFPADQKAVALQNRADHAAGGGGINFDAWRAMKVEQYLMGKVAERGDHYVISIMLYDVNSETRILAADFTRAKSAMRPLAHDISDRIIEHITGFTGICNTKILFATEKAPGVREIAVMDWDGYNIRQLTNSGTITTYPTWGNNATEMYYLSYGGNRGNIYGQLLSYDVALNVGTGQRWTIASYGGTNHSPAWSQAARQIAMVLSKDGNSEIYTSDRSGKGPGGGPPMRLTKTKHTEGSPTWSPDGRRIAFTSNDAGGAHIYVMNSDGSGRKRITNQGSWCDAVSWSPDSTRLVFAYREKGRTDIYTCDVSGTASSYRRLTKGQGNNESPTWAPNGIHIAFNSDRTGTRQVYIMLDDGSNQRPLTTTGNNMMPAWGPKLGAPE